MIARDIRLELHSKTDCPYCEQAKAFLTTKDLAFDLVVHDDDQERQALYDDLGLQGAARSVPQLVLHYDGERLVIGGWKQIQISAVESLKEMGIGPNDDNLKERTIVKEALTTEPVFLLRPTDCFAAEVAEFWISKVLPQLGESHPKVLSAHRRVAMIKAWQAHHGCKHPD